MASSPKIYHGTRVRILKDGEDRGKTGIVTHIFDMSEPIEYMVAYDDAHEDDFDPYAYFHAKDLAVLAADEQPDEYGHVLIQQALGEDTISTLQDAVERYSFYSIDTSTLRALLRVYRAYYDNWYERH